jgi:hypothetical protein
MIAPDSTRWIGLVVLTEELAKFLFSKETAPGQTIEAILRSLFILDSTLD